MLRVAALALGACLLAAGGAWAVEGDVSLAGQVILRIRCPAAGYSVAQRVEEIQSRLIEALSLEDFEPEEVRVRKVGGDVAVYVRSLLVITVDGPTARWNKTTPPKLAAIWARNLRKALTEAMPRERVGVQRTPTSGGVRRTPTSGEESGELRHRVAQWPGKSWKRTLPNSVRGLRKRNSSNV